MKIIIDNKSLSPIYEQIMLQIKKQIIEGEIKGGQKLTSIRALAKDLGISILTIKKAYDLLEKEGFIKSVQGKGSFVLDTNSNFVKEERQKEIETYISKIIDLAYTSGISKKEILEIFDYMYEQ